ncbi:MAG: ABC transporter ATP-binding protein, partial [Acidimicrobiales bacterium]
MSASALAAALDARSDAPRPPVLEALNLYRFYHAGDEEVLALRGVSLQVSSGEMVAVVGPSGSGKSTLLACLAGLDDPDGGRVYVAGDRISRVGERRRARLRARQLGVLLQSGNLIEHLSVADNVRLARRLAGQRAGASSADLLGRLGIADRADALPSTLSGGELARAGLAVAVANDPPLLLADEPTGELDTASEAEVGDLLAEQAARGLGVVVVTHSAALAARAGRVIELHDGRV